MKSNLPPFDLDRFLDWISSRLNLSGNITVNRPAEASRLEAVPRSKLDSASAGHGLRVVRRMGGSIFEFTRLPLFDFPYQTLQYPR